MMGSTACSASFSFFSVFSVPKQPPDLSFISGNEMLTERILFYFVLLISISLLRIVVSICVSSASRAAFVSTIFLNLQALHPAWRSKFRSSALTFQYLRYRVRTLLPSQRLQAFKVSAFFFSRVLVISVTSRCPLRCLRGVLDANRQHHLALPERNRVDQPWTGSFRTLRYRCSGSV